jgi:hypothetical protein
MIVVPGAAVNFIWATTLPLAALLAAAMLRAMIPRVPSPPVGHSV